MAWYKTGTITVTNGSTSVTGAGTSWVDVGTLNPGDILVAPDGKQYEILSIVSNNGLTLASNYLGSSLSGQTYSIYPIGLLPSTLALQVKTTLSTANTALASAVRFDMNAQGLTSTQQQNARSNIASLAAIDVGFGRLSKSVAGGTDITLTATEAANQFIELTGTLTGNINVVVPAAPRLFFIYNGTSGAFSVTLKTAAGSGVAVSQGGRTLLECDATNVVSPLANITVPGSITTGTISGSASNAMVLTLNRTGAGSSLIDLQNSGTSYGQLASNSAGFSFYSVNGAYIDFWSNGIRSFKIDLSGVGNFLNGLNITGSAIASGGVTSGGPIQINGGGKLCFGNSGNTFYPYITAPNSDQFEFHGSAGGSFGAWTSAGLSVSGTITTSSDLVLSNSAYIYSTAGGSGVRAGFQLDGANAAVKIVSAGSVIATYDSNGHYGFGISPNPNLKAFFVTTGAGQYGVQISNDDSTCHALIVSNGSTSGSSKIIGLYTDNGIQRGSIDFDRTNVLVRYNTTSDQNLKTLLGDAPGDISLSILRNTRIRSYYWNDDLTKKAQIGAFAQELYQVYPGAVSVGGDDPNTENYQPWGVDKTAYVWHMVAGWQDHESRIAALESKAH